MNRLVHILLVLLCFEMGAVLLYLPWSAFWEQNYFLIHYPMLIHFILNPSLRGAVSGLGVLDLILAARMVRRGPHPSQPARG